MPINDRSSETNLTPDEWRRVRQFAEADTKDKQKQILIPDSKEESGKQITKKVCNEARKIRREKRWPFVDIADRYYVSRASIRMHIKGKCTHNTKEDPVKSQGENKYNKRTDAEPIVA